MINRLECFAYLCNELMKYEDKLENANKEYQKTKSYFDSLQVRNYESIILEIKYMIDKCYKRFIKKD